LEIVDCVAHERGQLFISFNNGFEIYVEEALDEKWYCVYPIFSQIVGGSGTLYQEDL